MKTRIQKWGNSLGLRIPRTLAEEIGVVVGSEVELTVEDGRLVGTPTRKRRYRLRDLLSEVTSENLHDEMDGGESMGRERW